MTIAIPDPPPGPAEPGPGQLAPELAAELRRRFDARDCCAHCGGIHARACPRVKRLVFHPGSGGILAEVEFWPHGKWPEDGIIWPEDAPHPPTN